MLYSSENGIPFIDDVNEKLYREKKAIIERYFALSLIYCKLEGER